MTNKSRTLRKAGAVVLSLAMAFSVAGVAPSADAAAKKPALSAKKGTITVGKTKAVKIKNTTAKKVKKLVVSTSNKKVATVTKKSKVKFIVTGKKAGTAKITAKVTLKKAVAKKKVYTLKYTATVKKAATPTTAPDVTATPGELKLESVEGSQRTTQGVNTIVAYFSAAVADFAATDVEIRRVSDNKLFTVEKVVPSSDKKTATLSLTGTSSAGTAGTTEFLVENIEYKLIVKANGKTLEKVFIIPRVEDNAVVTAVNKKDGKISLNGTEYALGDGVTVADYFDILGKTVTAEVDNTGKITKLNVVELKTVIGAFKYTAGTATANASYKEVISGTAYNTTPLLVSNASTYATQTVQYNTKFAVADTAITGGVGTAIPGSDLAWGKLVLNPDGTIRTVQGLAAITNTAYVTKNEDGVITNGASAKLNLKDYVLIKDGKLVEAKTLAEKDIVFYSSSAAIGYILNNSVSGTFTKDYTTSFVFGDKEYKHAVTSIKDAKEAALTTAKVSDLITAKTALTAFLNLKGEVAYVIGEAAALTSTVNLFVTSSGTSGTGDAASASVTGYNPATKAMETYTWTGESLVAKSTVDGWNSATHTSQVPTLVQLTVKAEDGKTVTKVAAKAAIITNAKAFVDGADSDETPDVETKISKNTKLVGTTAGDGMNTAAAKVVVFKNPAKDTDAWAATNFTVSDFSAWTGYVTDGGVDGGVFAGTSFFGTASKTLDFVLTNGTTQSNAGAVGVEAGKSFPAYVTSVSSGTSKRLVAVTPEGEATYEAFNSDTTKVNLATVTKDTFCVITLSKTFDTDKMVYSVEAATASKYAATATAGDVVGEACNGSSLNLVSDGTFDIASDCLVIKSTTKDGNKTYALSDASSITLGSSIDAYTATGNNTTVKIALFTAETATKAAAKTLAENKIDGVYALAGTKVDSAADYKALKDALASAKGAIAVYVGAGGATADLTTSNKAYSDYTAGVTQIGKIDAAIKKMATITSYTWATAADVSNIAGAKTEVLAGLAAGATTALGTTPNGENEGDLVIANGVVALDAVSANATTGNFSVEFVDGTKISKFVLNAKTGQKYDTLIAAGARA